VVLGELLLSRFRLREAGFAGSSAAQVGLVGPEVRRRASSPHSRSRTRSCCQVSRIGRQRRICGRTAGRQSTRGDKHLLAPSSPSRTLGSPYCKPHSSQWNQTTSSSPSCRAEGCLLCTTSDQPPRVCSRSNRTSSNLRASTCRGP